MTPFLNWLVGLTVAQVMPALSNYDLLTFNYPGFTAIKCQH